jgi:hypothetical protein
MTIIELAEKVSEIEAKYTKKSNFSINVRYNEGKIRYRIEHTKTDNGYKSFDTGFGTSNIKDLLRTFELSMHNLYRLTNDIDNIIIDE